MINEMSILKPASGNLFGLEAEIQKHPGANGLDACGQLVYTPVNREDDKSEISQSVVAFFDCNPDIPAAVIVAADGTVMAQKVDLRGYREKGLQRF